MGGGKVERGLLGHGGMRRSTVLLGLAVTAGAVVTVGSGWRVARPMESRGSSGTQSGAQARMGASADAGYRASQWAERNGLRQVDGLEVAEAGTERRREREEIGRAHV